MPDDTHTYQTEIIGELIAFLNAVAGIIVVLCLIALAQRTWRCIVNLSPITMA